MPALQGLSLCAHLFHCPAWTDFGNVSSLQLTFAWEVNGLQSEDRHRSMHVF